MEKLPAGQKLAKSAHEAPVLPKHLFSTLSFTDKAYHAPEGKKKKTKKTFLIKKISKRKRKKENRKGPDPFS